VTRPRGTGSAPRRARRPGRYAKRALDLGVSVMALILLTPVMIGIALAIRLTVGSPVMFRQVRPGLRGAPFELVKFRTMREPSPASARPTPGATLFHDDRLRLTGLGRLLRQSSLDELPQLWNIARGDMSLVGPRPLLTEYLPRYSAEEARRHDVPPGLTGWAQVHGRRGVPFRERLAMDVWYVDNWSFQLDLRILVLTMRHLVARDQAVPASSADPWFDGFSPAGYAPTAPTEPARRQEDAR
jgi:lipopolysaccharide/colanic/teichoic acid biosynthesis glycosyltransferase